MLQSSPMMCAPEDRGLFKTGMFLRPNVAKSVQVLIHNRSIQDRAKFTVHKSQIHPNGLCEVVVKKQDPNVSTTAIMELLTRCRDLVQTHCPDMKAKDTDLNGTIDLSDSDDSIVVLSSPHYGGRKISFKRTFTPNVESTYNQLAYEPVPKKLNNMSVSNLNVEVPSSNVDDSRKVSLVSTSPKGLKSLHQESSKKLTVQDKNIVVQVSNKVEPLLSPESDSADSSVVILDVVEDARPSAPTWTSFQDSKFPLATISKNLGKNLIMGSEEQKETSCGSETQSCESGAHQLKDVTKKNEQKIINSGFFSRRSFSDVLKGTCDTSSLKPSNEPVSSLEKSGGSTQCSVAFAKETNSKSEQQHPAGPKQNCEKTGLGPIQHVGADKQLATISKKSTSAPSNIKVTISNTDIPVKRVTEMDARAAIDLSVDDEIIIEKELRSDKAPSHALIIDDSDDDDIAVCEVITGGSASTESKLKSFLPKQGGKKKKQKQKSPCKVSAGANATGADFIPIVPAFRRNDPNTSNCSRNFNDKINRYQKLQNKKNKKIQAIQSRKVGSTSSRSEVPETEKANAEKKEFGANILNPNSGEPKSGLRPIVIDASNVAVGHGRGSFSVTGLKICIKYFTDRGHKVIAIVPKYRRFHVSPDDRKTLDDFENQGIVSFTPSRTMEDGRRVASYDDRYIVQVAAELGGIIVSTDNYRDLLKENESWRETIEQRLLMFTWVGDMILFPNDPLGRLGPHLQDFLQFPNVPSK